MLPSVSSHGRAATGARDVLRDVVGFDGVKAMLRLDHEFLGHCCLKMRIFEKPASRVTTHGLGTIMLPCVPVMRTLF